jgi:hypothetical protein
LLQSLKALSASHGGMACLSMEAVLSVLQSMEAFHMCSASCMCCANCVPVSCCNLQHPP